MPQSKFQAIGLSSKAHRLSQRPKVLHLQKPDTDEKIVGAYGTLAHKFQSVNTIAVQNGRKRLNASLITAVLSLPFAFAAFGEVAFTNLFVFSSEDKDTNGVFPKATLVESRSGDLYGTTAGVRMNGSGRRIRPTIFKISAEGAFLTLAWFDPTNAQRTTATSGSWGSDETLTSSLLESTDGNFYGVALEGGEFGYGRVFKMNPSGTVATLHSFDGRYGTNGSGPMAGLVEGKEGWFYGTAYNGGIKTRNDNAGMGTVYKINADGLLKALFYFNGTNGEFPASSLLLGKDGFFYGTTPYGGPAYALGPPEHGFGTIFRITAKGTLTNLLSFNGTNGSMPYAALIQGTDGSLYGTTKFGAFGYGTVFRVTSDGVFTSLFSFNGANGARPNGALVQGRDGHLYGTTEFGGVGYRGAKAGIEHLFNETFGTIFRISTNGDFASLFSFSGTNGSHPSAGLLRAKDGAFYGTTQLGGTCFDGRRGAGTIFRFKVTSP
jgi:uncharacterized repeat protein (TIGR03803 family)